MKRFKLEADKRQKVASGTKYFKPDLVNCDVFASKTNSELGDAEEKRSVK